MCVCARSTCACASGTRYAARIRDETRPTIVATVEETREPSPSHRDNSRHEIFERSRFSTYFYRDPYPRLDREKENRVDYDVYDLYHLYDLYDLTALDIYNLFIDFSSK